MSSASSVLTRADRWAAFRLRLGIGRSTSTVCPGLYAVNDPDADSPVLASANYRLSFDILRSSLDSVGAWILVLDTRGINVWCAAGKGTFGTDELVERIGTAELDGVVRHRTIIVPQLGAPGVAAHEVKRRTGFRVVYGPVEARDIPEFLAADMTAAPRMREKRFPLRDRLVLTPVELVQSWKVVLPLIAIAIASTWLIDGVAAIRISDDVVPTLLGTLAGAVLTPLFLPWLPSRAFSAKGAVAGTLVAIGWGILVAPSSGRFVLGAGTIIALASFLAMNFTGSSTYTSLSGVRKEMRIAVPAQIAVMLVALGARVVIGLIREA